MRYLRVSAMDAFAYPHLRTLVSEFNEGNKLDIAMFDWIAVPEDHPNLDAIMLMLDRIDWIDGEHLPQTDTISLRGIIG